MKKLLIIALALGFSASMTYAENTVGEDSKVDCTKIFEGSGSKTAVSDGDTSDESTQTTKDQ
jgi:hypothetical protein